MKDVLFHQDNAPAHMSVVAMAAVCDCCFELVDYPPYFPDLAPSDYFLFPNMKKHLVGKQYRKASSRGAYGHDPFWSIFEEYPLDSTTTDITMALFIL